MNQTNPTVANSSTGPAAAPLAASWQGQCILLVSIGLIQLIATLVPWLTLATAIPLISLARSTQNDAANQTRPSRFYLACLIVAATSAVSEISAFFHLLSDPVDASAADLDFGTVYPHLSRGVIRAALPICCGLAGLIVFGQMDAELSLRGDRISSLAWIEKLSEFLEQNDAPQTLLQYMSDLNRQLTTVSKQYGTLGNTAADSTEALQRLSATAEAATQQLRELQQQLGHGQQEFGSMRQQMERCQSDLAQLHSEVDQMGDVLDSFAEIAEHSVLRYRPNETSSVEPASR